MNYDYFFITPRQPVTPRTRLRPLLPSHVCAKVFISFSSAASVDDMLLLELLSSYPCGFNILEPSLLAEPFPTLEPYLIFSDPRCHSSAAGNVEHSQPHAGRDCPDFHLHYSFLNNYHTASRPTRYPKKPVARSAPRFVPQPARYSNKPEHSSTRVNERRQC